MKAEIIEITNELLILNKPSGVSCTAQENSRKPWIFDPDELRIFIAPNLHNAEFEFGLLHRLDHGTSGVLAFARTIASFEKWKDYFRGKATAKPRKCYRALVKGNLKLAGRLPIHIAWPIARSTKSKGKVIVLDERKTNWKYRGPPLSAETTVTRAHGSSDDVLDLEIIISAGRMHQIRAHLSAYGCPILGDNLYGGPENTRLWLHAWKLDQWQAPLPQEWANAIAPPLD